MKLKKYNISLIFNNESIYNSHGQQADNAGLAVIAFIAQLHPKYLISVETIHVKEIED